jgi:hypothetical protein
LEARRLAVQKFQAKEEDCEISYGENTRIRTKKEAVVGS